jgi:YHYH protein
MRGTVLRTGLALAALAASAAAVATPADAHGGHSDSDTDLTSLPLGKTVSDPTVGGLWTCQTFTAGNSSQAGAQTTGPWIHNDGTWDANKKYTVDGSVEWPDAELTIKKHNGTRVITTKDLPVDHTTGQFPVSPTDDAYKVDRNPNSIKEQGVVLELDATPELADAPSCVGGEVGILRSGVLLFDAVDAGGRDAVAYEVQDSCDGHPQQAGLYHYHSASDCVLDKLDSGTGQSKLIGWAFDGFGIYGPRDANGKELTSADLDECHGITSRVKFNAKWQKIYHYVATVDYPYTVGCYRGTSAIQSPIGGGGGGRPPGA